MPGTGISCCFLLKVNEQLKRIIKENNGAIEFSSIYSHWNTIAFNDEYMLIRATCGGYTASEKYKPHYFFNLISSTRRIFGKALVGILSTHACPRAVNYKNSTQFSIPA